MIVKITCACNATFEIKSSGSRHPKSVHCPNCGRELPDNSSDDLFKSLDSFETFKSKVENSGHYEVKISE